MYYSPAWQASWLFDSIRGYDRVWDNVPKVHDGRYASARGHERSRPSTLLDNHIGRGARANASHGYPHGTAEGRCEAEKGP